MEYIGILKLLIITSVFLSVLALGLRARTADVFYLFREWPLGLRAFLAMYVVVPLVAAFLVSNFDIKHEVKVALLVLSVSPVPPLLPKKQLKTGGEGSYIIGLLVAGALVSPLVVPAGLYLFGAFFGVHTEVSLAKLITTLVITILAPLLLGLLAQRFLRERSDRISAVLGKFAALLLIACGLVLLVMLLPALGHLIGEGTVIALAGMILAGLAAGYLLGGRSKENRTALALAAASRHPGVAMGIAAANFSDEKAVLVAILLYTLVAIVLSLPLVVMGKRQSAD